VFAWLFGSRSVRSRLDDLESSVNSLKSSFKAIEADWESTYQKLHAARVSINQKLRMAERNAQDAPGATNGNPVAPTGPSDLEMLRRAFPRR
jgi:hypothetical protein